MWSLEMVKNMKRIKLGGLRNRNRRKMYKAIRILSWRGIVTVMCIRSEFIFVIFGGRKEGLVIVL